MGESESNSPHILGPHGKIVSITFCSAGQLRMRKIVLRSRARVTIKYPGLKPSRMVECESPHERNLCRLLDIDPSVTMYTEQPCEIVYLLDGRERRHYPDFKVDGSGARLREVKQRDEAYSSEVHERTCLLSEELPYYGYSYEVEIAEELAKQPRLGIATLILRFGRRSISQFEREFVRRKFSLSGSLTWGGACAGILGPYGRELLCRLIIEGVLTIDFNRAISSSTAFSLRNGEF